MVLLLLCFVVYRSCIWRCGVGVCVCMLVCKRMWVVCGRVVVRCRLCGVCMGGGEVHASGAM